MTKRIRFLCYTVYKSSNDPGFDLSEEEQTNSANYVDWRITPIAKDNRTSNKQGERTTSGTFRLFETGVRNTHYCLDSTILFHCSDSYSPSASKLKNWSITALHGSFSLNVHATDNLYLKKQAFEKGVHNYALCISCSIKLFIDRVVHTTIMNVEKIRVAQSMSLIPHVFTFLNTHKCITAGNINVVMTSLKFPTTLRISSKKGTK